MSTVIRTDAGANYQAALLGNPTSNGTGSYAPACWIGVTANTTPPAATDTTLAGEITVGTLARKKATFAHTTGATSYTLSALFTFTQSVKLAKSGVFNAQTGGTMFLEGLMASPATGVSGDQVQVVVTVNI